MTGCNDSILKIAVDGMGKYDCLGSREHAMRVEGLAVKIYNAMGKYSHLGEDDLCLLKAACLLHDIGHFVCEAEHDMASEWLIRHDDLFDGIPKKLRQDLAAVAGSHRKGLSHLIEDAGEKRMRKLIRLSAILRTADALEYMQMEGISVTDIKTDKDQLNIMIQGLSFNNLLERFNKKSELFTHSYGMEIRFMPHN